eukprot:s1264_g11.t1
MSPSRLFVKDTWRSLNPNKCDLRSVASQHSHLGEPFAAVLRQKSNWSWAKLNERTQRIVALNLQTFLTPPSKTRQGVTKSVVEYHWPSVCLQDLPSSCETRRMLGVCRIATKLSGVLVNIVRNQGWRGVVKAQNQYCSQSAEQIQKRQGCLEQSDISKVFMGLAGNLPK